jgi:alkylhydroperoxidase family enzyme
MARITETPKPGTRGPALWQGQRPRMATAAVALSQAVYQETSLSFREAEGARMRIAHINGCILCKNFKLADDLANLLERSNSTEDANVNDSRGETPTAEFYEAVLDWRTSNLFSPREKLAIEFAERIAESPQDLPYDDEIWSRLNANFDEGEIVDLAYSITTWIATGRFVHVLGLDGVCPTSAAAQGQLVA